MRDDFQNELTSQIADYILLGKANWFASPPEIFYRGMASLLLKVNEERAHSLLQGRLRFALRETFFMRMAIPFSKSLQYISQYSDLAFGLTLISGCQNFLNPPGFDHHKRRLLRKMRRRETLTEITERIESYDRFFGSFGFECPLPKHLKRTVNSGFPRYNLMVDAHFMAEMCAGILVAVADYDRFDGKLTLDLAEEGEICRGMGQLEWLTKQGEIVFRDETEIVCVLCQGADEKTRVRDHTQNVLFYAYAIPGIEGRYLREGLTIAAEIMSEFGQGTIEWLEIF